MVIELVVMAIKRAANVQKQVEEKCKSGHCLYPGCSKPQIALGNCVNHVQRVYRGLAKVPAAKRTAARAKLIESGLVLAPYECYDMKSAADPITKAIKGA